MWTTVLLNEEYMLAIPQWSTRFSEMVASSSTTKSGSVRSGTVYYSFVRYAENAVQVLVEGS